MIKSFLYLFLIVSNVLCSDYLTGKITKYGYIGMADGVHSINILPEPRQDTLMIKVKNKYYLKSILGEPRELIKINYKHSDYTFYVLKSMYGFGGYTQIFEGPVWEYGTYIRITPLGEGVHIYFGQLDVRLDNW